MNKDVIYIEPEDDITDILANIKSAKNKIVALVPPKKAGVLRSAVNFKLIAKTSRQAGKAVVLITSDESLLKLAENVKMPTARTLQSKPKLPSDMDTEEFGDEKKDDADENDNEEVTKEDDDPNDSNDDDVIEEEPKKIPVKKESSAKAAAASKRKEADLELDDDDFDDDEEEKKSAKKKANKNIPDFKKVRTPIIIAVIAILLIFGIGFWAFSIAPAAKISVKIKTIAQNFNESITFVTDETKAKPEDGIFFIEQKTLTKTAETEFVATGEVDKGTKATGSITVTRPAGTVISNESEAVFSIPAGTEFTNDGLTYVTSVGGSVNVDVNNSGQVNKHCTGGFFNQKCTYTLKSVISSGSISVVAKSNGEKYNIEAKNSGWSSSLSTSKAFNVSGTAMTGGTSKKVKVVSQKDVETAEAGLEGEGESDAREELASQFSNEYLLIEKSFTATSGKITASPSINEEVKDGIKPKVIKEIKYTIFAVKRDDLSKFIEAKTEIGDDTQTIYSTGVSSEDGEDNKVYIDSFKKEDNKYVGRLKTVVKTGPEVTEQMVSDKSLGKKIGEVQSLLKSIKGISEVKVDTSYFWVTSVPSDPNKVTFEITVE